MVRGGLLQRFAPAGSVHTRVSWRTLLPHLSVATALQNRFFLAASATHKHNRPRRSPDGLSVLIVADFGVRMTVWSLVDRRCAYLPGPKHAARGLAFEPEGGCMAVLEVGPAVSRLGVVTAGAAGARKGGEGGAHAARYSICVCMQLHRMRMRTVLTPMDARTPPITHPQRKECKDWVALYDYESSSGWGLRSRWVVCAGVHTSLAHFHCAAAQVVLTRTTDTPAPPVQVPG